MKAGFSRRTFNACAGSAAQTPRRPDAQALVL